MTLTGWCQSGQHTSCPGRYRRWQYNEKTDRWEADGDHPCPCECGHPRERTDG